MARAVHAGPDRTQDEKEIRICEIHIGAALRSARSCRSSRWRRSLRAGPERSLPTRFTSNGGPSAIATPATGGIALLAPLLHSLTDRLAELARRSARRAAPGPMLALAAAALLYGIFHAVGPGHGKTIVSTFFLAKDAKLRHSLIAGYLDSRSCTRSRP